MRKIGAILLLALFCAPAHAAPKGESAAGAVGDFKRWCLSRPLEFGAFSKAVKSKTFEMQFDRKSPVSQGLWIESVVWEATDGAAGPYGLAAVTGAKNGKPIPMSCGVVIAGPMAQALDIMRKDARFGLPKAKKDTQDTKSVLWNGPLPQSEIQLIEINAGKREAQTEILFSPHIQ